jgi:hypothetical protein
LFRHSKKMKTVSVALVLCLNVGVDPPDIIKTSPCARLECWIGLNILLRCVLCFVFCMLCCVVLCCVVLCCVVLCCVVLCCVVLCCVVLCCVVLWVVRSLRTISSLSYFCINDRSVVNATTKSNRRHWKNSPNAIWKTTTSSTVFYKRKLFFALNFQTQFVIC